jgi:hypothetical protein
LSILRSPCSALAAVTPMTSAITLNHTALHMFEPPATRTGTNDRPKGVDVAMSAHLMCAFRSEWLGVKNSVAVARGRNRDRGWMDTPAASGGKGPSARAWGRGFG